ncbi:MAG: hypothetical protein ACR2KQ_04125 [Actinomycetota bacterium]
MISTDCLQGAVRFLGTTGRDDRYCDSNEVPGYGSRLGEYLDMVPDLDGDGKTEILLGAWGEGDLYEGVTYLISSGSL